MKTKALIIMTLSAAVGLLVYVQLSAAPAAEPAKPAPAKAELGKPAPDFALKDAYGKEFKLSEFKNKIVVLEWLNQNCPISGSLHKKQVMQNTYKKYAEQGAIWLGIDTTDGRQPEQNRVYAARMGLAYPILHDVEGKVGRAFGATHTPHMFVIDKAGKLAYKGAIDDQDKTNYVELAIKDLLAGKAVAKAQTDPYGCTVKYPKPKAAAR